MTTRSGEIVCFKCFEQLEHSTDDVLEGKDAATAMPLVQDLLDRCQACREEYEALLAAPRASA
jgi:hypothetical protein